MLILDQTENMNSKNMRSDLYNTIFFDCSACIDVYYI